VKKHTGGGAGLDKSRIFWRFAGQFNPRVRRYFVNISAIPEKKTYHFNSAFFSSFYRLYQIRNSDPATTSGWFVFFTNRQHAI
jgi:hypothetical protein